LTTLPAGGGGEGTQLGCKADVFCGQGFEDGERSQGGGGGRGDGGRGFSLGA